MAAAIVFMALGAAADPARIGDLQIAGHDPVDPALRRFTGKVVAVLQPAQVERVSSLRFIPIGPGMVPPKPGELRGWRLTFITGALFGRTMWIEANTPDEFTVRDTDPTLAGVVEGDIVMIELLDPKLIAPTSQRDDEGPRRLAAA